MKEVTICLSDEAAERAYDAFAKAYHWSEAAHGNKSNYFKTKLCEYVRDVTKGFEMQEAQEAARQAAQNASTLNVEYVATEEDTPPVPPPNPEPEPVVEPAPEPDPDPVVDDITL